MIRGGLVSELWLMIVIRSSKAVHGKGMILESIAPVNYRSAVAPFQSEFDNLSLHHPLHSCPS
jgi:hypothetical protein